MKTNIKSIVRSAALALAAVLTAGLGACNPSEPSNEKENKLHEDPVRAVFTLQEGTLRGGKTFEAYPRVADFVPSAAPTQVIEWQTVKGEGWHAVKGAEGFSVKNTEDHPDVVYQLTMTYYNDKGEEMNRQFYENGQDKIHQHFFQMYRETMIDGQARQVVVTKKENLSYDYTYADELNGTFVGDKNPMGFQGFIKFTKPGQKFEVAVNLIHASGSKYDEKTNEPSPFYLPSRKMVSAGQWDLQVRLPITVDGNVETPKPDFEPARAKVQIISGHLHGTKFHMNPLRDAKNQLIGRNYELGYTLQGDEWVPDATNPKYVAIMSTRLDTNNNLPEQATAYVITYYDKDGNDITGEIAAEGTNQRYQHFFMVDRIQPATGGAKEETDRNDEGFFKYYYMDTNPWKASHHYDGAEVTGPTNPVGIKGYLGFLRKHKIFDLQIRLMCAKQSKFVDGKPSPYYAPTARQQQEEAWLPAIKIPTCVYCDSYDLDIEADFEPDLVDEEVGNFDTYSAEDQVTIKSIMEAFGVSLRSVLLDLSLRLYGEPADAESGEFWF